MLIGVDSGGHADDLLESLAPTGRDRPLTWHLALGVLRRRGSLDAMLQPHLRAPIAHLDPPVRAALRLGAFELHFGRTRDHAAVHQAVALSRVIGAGRASGLVNAVLRRVSTATLPTDPSLDVPPWLAERLRPWPQWLAKLHEPSPVCGVWRSATDTIPAIDGGPVRAAGQVVPGTFRFADGEGAITERPGFSEGKWWVMDPASVAVSDLLHHSLPEGASILDACAAPGGKSLRLASQGHPVTAVDLEARRLSLVTENALRVGVSVETATHDWLTGPFRGTYGGVLVDAPCSALGVIRRHPDIRWQRQPTDPSAMAIRQRQILGNAATHVAPDGVLVYSVCSPLPEEGIAVVERLSNFVVEQTWSSAPPQDDEDGFQAFVLRRKA